MKREILFRGLRTDGSGWVCGHYYKWYIKTGNKLSLSYRIIHEQIAGRLMDVSYVIPETVGQFTGLTDKNGTKIFENDKVKGKIPGHPQFEDIIYTVIFKDGAFQISFGLVCIELNALEQIEVIGNIYKH